MTQVNFKGTEIPLYGSFLKEGNLAPDFLLVTESLENVSLERYRGRHKVLVTLPSIDTSVCAKEAKRLNEIAIQHPSILFLVISQDLPFAAQRFCKDENLQNIVTLSNMRHRSNFSESYGVLMTEGPLAGLMARSVIVLDEGDKVVYSELVDEITNEPNYDALEAKLAEL